MKTSIINGSEVSRLSVAIHYAREGYAFEVITATIGWIKENGFSLIKAGVNPENNLSIKLLIKTGFNFSGIEEGEHIYVMDLTKGE
ncbi:GNAT family N-acetyltransferase [Citrobacter freundii]|uniref:GNAT family N-acetyltransferase n=1 Tax=Citrobacter freundii TaxID=546 RepID=UPI0039B4168A